MRRTTLVGVAAVAAAATLALSACSGGGGGTPSGDASGSITVWASSPTAPELVKMFEKAHPKIKVTLNKAATADQLQTALQAGSGGPDVAMVDYSLIAQYAKAKYLTALNDLGGDAVKDDYVESIIKQITVDGKLYGIPLDASPMLFFYRTDLFKAAGVTVPTTWDELATEAATYRSAVPDGYLINSALADQSLDQMLWQAGLNPIKTSGDSVKISYDSADAKKVTSFWGDLATEGTVANLPIGAPEWITAVSQGKIAALIAPAWFTSIIPNVAKDSTGNWGAAELPSWTAGKASSAQKGGSAYVVTEQSKNKAAAAEFSIWINHDKKATDYLFAQGAMPTLKSYVDNDSLMSAPFPFFGGQAVNQVSAKSLNAIPTTWQWAPFESERQTKVMSTEADLVKDPSSVDDSLGKLQSSLSKYAESQGFTVK